MICIVCFAGAAPAKRYAITPKIPKDTKKMSDGLFSRVVGHHLAVNAIKAKARDVANEVVVDVDHGQGLGIGMVKLLHHFLHRLVVVEERRYWRHELRDRVSLVKLGAEHDMANLQDVDFAEEMPIVVDHRKIVEVAV